MTPATGILTRQSYPLPCSYNQSRFRKAVNNGEDYTTRHPFIVNGARSALAGFMKGCRLVSLA